MGHGNAFSGPNRKRVRADEHRRGTLQCSISLPLKLSACQGKICSDETDWTGVELLEIDPSGI